jgi:predicted porin
LAAFAATASFAQTAYLPSGANVNPAWGSGVKIVGGFDVGYGQYNYKGANKVSSIAYNGSSTSQISFLGVEDLGGGTKADFWFESDINPVSYVGNPGVATLNGTFASSTAITTSNSTGVQSASTWGNGQVKAGIGGSFGYLAIGAVNNAGLDANGMTQPFGTAYGGGYGIGWSAVGYGYGSSAKVRYDNSARYLTPEVLPGLIGSLTYRPKNSTAANNMFSTSVGLQGQSGVQELAGIYRQGPIQAIFVNQVDDAQGVYDISGTVQTSAKKYTTNSLGGNYTMGAATLYAGIQNTTNGDASKNNKATRYGVKYMLNSNTSIAAAVTSLKGIDGTITRTTGIGADYFLSKMTAIYGRYEAVQDGYKLLASTEYNGAATGAGAAVTAATAGFNSAAAYTDQNRTRLVVGLRTNF